MDLVRDQHVGSSTNPSNIQVHGVRSIRILDCTLLQMSKPSKLSYCRGFVKSGDQRADACEAIIFKFEGSKAAINYDRLNAVNHPCVLQALGHGKGLGKHDKHSFLALRPFRITFEAYIGRHGPGVDENGRFTEEFIKLICDIIVGIEELHRLGYCCPKLKEDDIAVIGQCDSIRAKIWNFRTCKSESGDEEEKNEDWVHVGFYIQKAAGTSEEAVDLYKRIKSGQLKGKSILKHSALLTVRQKFENVLSLHLYTSLKYKQGSNQSKNKDLEVSKISVATLESDLDRRLAWVAPSYTQSQGSPIRTKTLRGYLNQLRIFIEHEVDYIPDEMTRELTAKELLDGKKKLDLERHLQKSSGKIFLAVQNLVAELDLKY